MNEIEAKLLGALVEREVNGTNVPKGTLRAQLTDGPTLLVFLRHFG